nr:hypothetical protein [Tanacetum cinerariifolium]
MGGAPRRAYAIDGGIRGGVVVVVVAWWWGEEGNDDGVDGVVWCRLGWWRCVAWDVDEGGVGNGCNGGASGVVSSPVKRALSAKLKTWTSFRVPSNLDNENMALLQPLDFTIHDFCWFFNQVKLIINLYFIKRNHK